MSRLRGLVTLVRDAVDAGSTRLEALQKETLAQPLAVLRAVPSLARPAQLVGTIVELSLTGTHHAIRVVNQAVAVVVDEVLKATGK